MVPPQDLIVTGATGDTGSALLTIQVRGTRACVWFAHTKTRRGWQAPQPQQSSRTSTIPASLAPALEGVTRADLVTPSSPHAEAQQVRFAEQAVAAGVKHLSNCRSSPRTNVR